MDNMKVKNVFLFAVLMATALFFVACASSDDADLTESEKAGVVKAEFTLSFPQQIVGATRMATDVVQGQPDPVFRGIQEIQLRPFRLSEGNVNSGTELSTPITLAAGTSSVNSIASDALYTTSKSHLYKDVSIPIGTRSFLFYGLATDKAADAGVSANAVNGSLIPNSTTPTGTLDDISFSPRPIATNTLNSQATTIADYLTSIATVSATVDTRTVTMLDYFPNFINLTTGSWNSVKAAVKLVYSSIKDNNDALSTAIKAAIEVAATPNATEVLVFDKGAYASLTYPANIGLPDGAAYVKWQDSDKKFVALANDNSMDIATLGTYAFPASLYYWGLSNIKTSANTKSSYYTNDRSWADILGQYDQDDALVQSTTRSIAIKKPVEYGVGRLDVTVCTNGGAVALYDATTYSGVPSQEIVIGTNFPITGILISNQRAVDYKFETKTDQARYTVYDGQIEAGAYLYAGSTPTFKTHTLVLETPTANSEYTTEEQMKTDENANVKIAVEFQNNSDKTIVGKDGCLIYPGTKFYLIGTLMPGKNGSNADDPKYIRGDKKGQFIKQAFVQDYVTTANFTVNSFQNAYNMLPDLRTPQLEIGLSVDLTWETGITQSIVIE